MNSQNSDINLYGSTVAFSSGTLIAIGLNLFNGDTAHGCAINSPSTVKKVMLNTLGGGAFVLGLYLVSPTLVRELWSVSLYKKH